MKCIWQKFNGLNTLLIIKKVANKKKIYLRTITIIQHTLALGHILDNCVYKRILYSLTLLKTTVLLKF